MSRKPNVIRGQFNLLQPDQLYNQEVVRNIDGHDVVTYYGPEGSYVDVGERARFLLTALVSLSERNRRDGFSIAPYREEYSEPIWSKYQWNTPTVIEGASRNRDAYQQQLRVSFWKATGFAAIRGLNKNPQTRVMPSQLVNPTAQKMWRDFNHTYGHPEGLSDRSRFKKQLAAQLPENTPPETVIARAENLEALEDAA